MKKSLAIVACVLLAGCSGTAVAPVAPTQTVSPVLPPPAATLSSTPVIGSPAPSPTPTPTSAATNDRGAIVKKVGEMAGMTTADGEWTAQFKVTKIETDFKCTAKYASKPKNGQFIAIHMDIQTTKALGGENGGKFWTDDWKVIGPDGTTENDSRGNSYGCVDRAEEVPAMIGPGEHVKGLVVVDTKYKSGSLFFTQISLVEGGWEWGF